MTALWVGIAVLTMLALVFIFYPFMRAHRLHRDSITSSRHRQNIDIFRDRLIELERERDHGVLDTSTFELLKLELEKNLLIDAEEEQTQLPVKPNNAQLVSLALIAIIFVSGAMGIYAQQGRAVDLEISLNQDPFDGRTPTLEEAITKLETELKARPDNAEGWYMLASTYLNVGRYQDGAQALAQVLRYLPAAESAQKAGITGQYAQALYFAAGNTLTPEVDSQIKATLALDSGEVTVLGLLGINAFEQQGYQEAIDYWVKALANAQGNAAESLRSGIEKAQQALKAQGAPVAKIPQLIPANIRVSISLSEALKAKTSPEQTVFVYARGEQQRAPLAAKKLKVADLPIEIVLDDSLAMMPQMKLSTVENVDVIARISMSGQPQSQPGDLISSQFSVPVRGQTATLELVIDKLVQ